MLFFQHTLAAVTVPGNHEAKPVRKAQPGRFLSLLALAALLAAPAAAQPQTDATASAAARQRTRELAEAIGAGSEEHLRHYVQNNFSEGFLAGIPLDRHVEILGGAARRHGGFEIAAFTDLSATSVAAHARSLKTGDWFRIVLEVEPQPPYRIASVGIAPGGPPVGLPTGEITDPKMVASLQSLVEQAAGAERFSGAVLLARGEQVLFKGAYGLACRRFNVPNRVDTRFNLGSMNKMFTAVAIGQLVEQGRLSLDDPLSRHLQGWLPKEAADRIRIRHLLNHTSGLGSYFNDRFMNSSRLLYREVKDYKPLIEGETPAFEPGTRWQYSNTGFLLLGAVIESVTGSSYFDYIREHVYKPAGMEASDSYEMDIPVPNLALGYFRDEQGVVRENTLMHVVKGGPAGGGYSTVEDLHRFALALQGGKLLSPRMLEMFTTAKPEENSPEYGYGFGVDTDPDMFGHTGGFPGISARLSVYRKDGYILAILSNYGAGSQEIATHVRALLHARR